MCCGGAPVSAKSAGSAASGTCTSSRSASAARTICSNQARMGTVCGSPRLMARPSAARVSSAASTPVATSSTWARVHSRLPAPMGI